MTKLEILNERLKRAEKAMNDAIVDKFKEILSNAGVLEDGDTLKGSSYSVEVLRLEEGKNYPTAMFNFYMKTRFTGDTDTLKELTLSYYSSNDQSRFEMMRLSTLGKVAKLMANYLGDITSQVGKVRSHHTTTIAALNRQVWTEESIEEKRGQETKRMMIEDFLISAQTEKGVLINDASLELRSNTYNKIKNFKITKMSDSGKTASIQFENQVNCWNHETTSFEDRIVSSEFDKVKVASLVFLAQSVYTIK